VKRTATLNRPFKPTWWQDTKNTHPQSGYLSLTYIDSQTTHPSSLAASHDGVSHHIVLLCVCASTFPIVYSSGVYTTEYKGSQITHVQLELNVRRVHVYLTFTLWDSSNIKSC